MKNDLVININLATQNDNQSLIGKSIARQLSLNATPINQSINNSIKPQPEIRAYKRRFLMIILSLLLCITNSYQWLQFSVVTDKLTLFYGISNLQVNLLSIVYFCVYVTCIIPITKLIERKGLRFSIILGASLNFLGTLIKCASVNQIYGFHIALFGQLVSGLACLLIFNIPPEIASTWFKSEEVSRVISLEVCSCFIGNAIAFFIPTMIVGHLVNIKDIAIGFYELYFGAMVITGSILLLTILFFEERPLHPPSLSQFYRLSATKGCEVQETTSILDLLKNRNLVIFIIYSSINAGVFDAFTTLLNQMILIEFPGDNSKVGTIGIIFILSGMVGSLFCGYLLDKLHKYKEISIVFYGMSIFFLVLFMLKLHFSSSKMIHTKFDELVNGQTISNNVLLHIYAICLGFFLIGYWTIRFDFGTELAYPYPASTVCGLTAGCCDIAGALVTLITSKVVDNYGTLASNLVLVVLLSAGMFLLCSIKPEYKRQAANANKPLINHNLNNNNNQINSSYGSLNENKWLLADHQLPKSSLIQVACKTEYLNFQFPSSNVVLAN